MGGTAGTSFTPTHHHMALADEMFKRRAKYGADYPGTFRRRSLKNLLDEGIVRETKVTRSTRYYYFTEAGYEWYLTQRPGYRRARPSDTLEVSNS